MRFRGKKVFITGSTKGLGLTTAKLFAKEGAELFLHYRNDEANAKKVLAEFEKQNIKTTLLKADLSVETELLNLYQQLKQQTSSLDVYVHNAAATAFKNLMELKSHHIDKTFNITVKSFIIGMQEMAPLMQPEGHVVTISGMDTLKAVPRHGLLGAAKSSLETLTQYMAHELASQNIHVKGINPGFFKTESTEKYLGPYFDKIYQKVQNSVPFKRGANLEELAQVILFLCTNESNWIVGQTINIDGGQDFSLPLFS